MKRGARLRSIRSSSAVEVISAVPPQPFHPGAMTRLEGCPVVRSPETTAATSRAGRTRLTGVIDEFNEAARLTNPSVTEPILISTNGTILAGFGAGGWPLLEGRPRSSTCIEYPIQGRRIDYSLFLTTTSRGVDGMLLSVFGLALKLEPYFPAEGAR